MSENNLEKGGQIILATVEPQIDKIWEAVGDPLVQHTGKKDFEKDSTCWNLDWHNEHFHNFIHKSTNDGRMGPIERINKYPSHNFGHRKNFFWQPKRQHHKPVRSIWVDATKLLNYDTTTAQSHSTRTVKQKTQILPARSWTIRA